MRLKEWPDFSHELLSNRGRTIGSVRLAADNDRTPGPEWTVHLKLTALRYDGITSTFKTQLHSRFVSFPWSRDGKGQAQITSLRVYPFSYALASRKDELVNRGAMFWGCRSIKHIQYSGLDLTRLHHFVSLYQQNPRTRNRNSVRSSSIAYNSAPKQSSTRFMVDLSWLTLLHGNSSVEHGTNRNILCNLLTSPSHLSARSLQSLLIPLP